MEQEEENKNKIELAFPKYEEENDGEFISKGGTGERLVKHLSTSMDAIANWFKQQSSSYYVLLLTPSC